MKIKKKIIDNWSLECKDNYQEIKEKISFSEPKKNKNKIFIKSISFSFASIIVLALILIPLLNGRFDVNGDAPNSNLDTTPPCNSDTPEDSGNNKDEENSEGEPNKPIPPTNSDELGDSSSDMDPINPEYPNEPEAPSNPSSPSEDYDIFIESFNNGLIYAPAVENITYYNKGVIENINDKNGLIEFLNSLKYEKYLGEYNEIENQLTYTLTFNSEWAKILLGNSRYILFSDGANYIIYVSNVNNIYEEIKEYLK